ncbi:hypothetical protein Leryth_009968 [Lithospermum erythrorhizon]|nr:hypothetical protein Leryth_009968 [Lithospermum erythrorhizon]
MFKICSTANSYHLKQFFGFKNPLVQRLLRELVANVSESAYPVIPPSTSCSDVLEKTNQVQCAESTMKPDILTSLPKPRVTRKRSRTYKGTKIKTTGEVGGTMLHSENENHNSDAPNSTEFSTASAAVDHHCSCSAAQSSLVPMKVESEENNGSRPSSSSQHGCLDLNHLNNLAVKVDDLCLQKPTRHSYSDFNNKSIEQAGSMPKDKEFIDRSMVVDAHDIEIKASLGEGEQTFISNSLQNVNDSEICVPDTSDIPLEAPDSVKDDITSTQMTDSGTLITESHPDDDTNSVAPTNSEKIDFDSVKSMMTVLLPRALPLLKTFSRKRKNNGKSSKKSLSNKDNTERGLCKDISPTGVAEDAKLNLTNQIQMEHFPTADSVVHNKVHVDAIIPDTFDDDGIGYQLTEPQAFHAHFAEAGPSSSGQGHLIDETFNQAVSINAEAGYQLAHAVAADFANPRCQDVRTHSDSPDQKCIVSSPPQETTANANISGIYGSQFLDSKEACGLVNNMNMQHMPASKFLEVTSKNTPNGACLTSNVTKEALEEKVSATDSLPSHFHNNKECSISEELNHGLPFQAPTYSNQYLKLIALYAHPMPIRLVLLSKNHNEIFICVVCGIPEVEEAVLFLYKAQMEGQDFGCTSFCGHSSIMLPSSRDVFGRNITVEKSGFQLTPDARFLVLLNSIRTPYCSDGNLKCSCGSCKANSCENYAVKIVQVKGGFVTVVTKMKTAGCVYCILVCGPTSLVAAEESGKLYLWVMNSSWSAGTAEYLLPTPDCIPPCTLELKKIPKAASLIIGHNGCGEFCLDIHKQIIVSKISSRNTLVQQLIPVSLFRWQTKGLDFVNSNVNFISSTNYAKNMDD